MKKYLFLLVAVVSLALSSGQAYAQRYLPKMMGVELRGGFVNGSKSPLNYYTGIAMSGYTKKANRWVVGAEYLLKNYDYRGTSVPRAQFTAEGGYYLKFLSDPTKTFFLSIGGSALAGYETVNWGDIYCLCSRYYLIPSFLRIALGTASLCTTMFMVL